LTVTTKALWLLGSAMVLTGVRPEAAHTMDTVEHRPWVGGHARHLQSGVAYAMARRRPKKKGGVAAGMTLRTRAVERRPREAPGCAKRGGERVRPPRLD
jgi:hypothetical protein